MTDDVMAVHMSQDGFSSAYSRANGDIAAVLQSASDILSHNMVRIKNGLTWKEKMCTYSRILYIYMYV